MKTIVNKVAEHFGVRFIKPIDIEKQVEYLLKPIVIMDKAYELFAELPSKEYRFKEKQAYKACKQSIDKFYTWVFEPLTEEERMKFADEMTDASEWINNSVVLLDQCFQRFMMFVPAEQRVHVSAMYVMSVVAQCAVRMMKPLKVETYELEKFEKNIYDLQKAYFSRIYPHKCCLNPNHNQDIKDSVEGYINNMMSYKIA